MKVTQLKEKNTSRLALGGDFLRNRIECYLKE